MTTKILVVDDETDLQSLIKQKFRRQIREQKYEFVFAVNGEDALEKLKENPEIDLVLSDINMPKMDGLTLLIKLNEFSPMIKAVIVSAYSDMDKIRTAMNRGAFDFVCKPVDFTDLGVTIEKTIQHIQQLKKTLEAIKENTILRMYVDANVLQFMTGSEFENGLAANETIEATVVFMDICGFTAISEKVKPDVVVRIINHYFDVMVGEIINQGGYVDKFMGDAIMAVFRNEYHLDRAIEACLAVRAKINAIEEDLTSDLKFHPKVAIGINSGEMICGNIGSTTLRRLDYTVIGDTVNVAQRFQSIAKPGQIIISEKAHELVKESFMCREVGTVELKNKANPVLVYEVVE
ncbi:adenylate/guanylate cyclase domain-containing protein [Arundinibacter roseus]|uniref:Adenylate/guanylate cyclase domain-containing response regulator n=1 Tax=Arundinibacter roseus TaxID=2070510 RepID=A0A4V2X7V1_9BACT|nr:adenylate/guanylate cyclase domain-containing protein [Arundinibacter roseus]TDB57355.1 adenylate/guanylate cyclase domain-containing response regulator [Arundinibacter roseus]